MKELVPIFKSTIDNEEVNSVNARDLHEALEVGRDFSTWIKKRIEQCEFVQGIDFVTLTQMGESGFTQKIEYALTLDAAKHIAMLERNDRGKMIRQYFIDFEKVARERLPSTPMEADAGVPGVYRMSLIGCRHPRSPIWPLFWQRPLK